MSDNWLFDNSAARFDMTGEVAAIVDMPTMWVRSTKPTGDGELPARFWANETFDPDRPGTFPEPVGLEAKSSAIA